MAVKRALEKQPAADVGGGVNSSSSKTEIGALSTQDENR